jgi:hypothetical protein
MYGRSTAAPHVRKIDPLEFFSVFALALDSFLRARLTPSLAFSFHSTRNRLPGLASIR